MQCALFNEQNLSMSSFTLTEGKGGVDSVSRSSSHFMVCYFLVRGRRKYKFADIKKNLVWRRLFYLFWLWEGSEGRNRRPYTEGTVTWLHLVWTVANCVVVSSFVSKCARTRSSHVLLENVSVGFPLFRLDLFQWPIYIRQHDDISGNR